MKKDKLDKKVINELREYLENWIYKNKDKKLHLLDISMHLTMIKLFTERLHVNYNGKQKEPIKEIREIIDKLRCIR